MGEDGADGGGVVTPLDLDAGEGAGGEGEEGEEEGEEMHCEVDVVGLLVGFGLPYTEIHSAIALHIRSIIVILPKAFDSIRSRVCIPINHRTSSSS